MDAAEGQVGIAENKIVGEAQDSEALRLEPAISPLITHSLLGIFMWRTVELHDNASGEADEVSNVRADRNLPSEFEAVEAAGPKFAPEHHFCARHCPTLGLRELSQM